MIPVFTEPGDPRLRVFLDRIEALFSDMDRGYETAAARYGFICRGCEENCCRTRFHHHTYLETLHMGEGFKTLGPEKRRRILKKAKTISQITSLADRKGLPVREMCPLNEKDRCLLYAYRPMICRLHGIPHQLLRFGGDIRHHPGCNAFHRQHPRPAQLPFDRTPFYSRLAGLEREFKIAHGLSQKVKWTIPEMLLALAGMART